MNILPFITESIYSMILTVFSTTIVIFIQNFANKHTSKKENEEIKNEVDQTLERIKTSDNVIDLMIRNVGELREYYVISKQQANKSFSSAILICFLGFILFTTGIILYYTSNYNVIIFTTIAGAIVELISGSFFFLYKYSLNQLNLYHERLGTTEKYLTAMQLIEKTSKEAQDANYRFLLESILIDNSSIIRSSGTKPNT